MMNRPDRFRFAAVLLVFALAAQGAMAATEDLGGGFLHHGVATPISNHRGTVATVDGDGRNVVLVWLFDLRGGYAILMIDAETGGTRQVATPFPPGGDCPYASILSAKNKYYTHFNGHFAEFDPAKGRFTFFRPTTRQMAMSMTEDDRGVIWSVTYPNSGLVSYDPATHEFNDYGSLHQENWLQYPRHIAADDQGWVYFGIGNTHSHLMAFDRNTQEVHEIAAQAGEAKGCGFVYRNLDGRVYAHHPGENDWYRLHGGASEKIGSHERGNVKPIIAGSQDLVHCDFPDGSQLVACDLVDRILKVKASGSGPIKQVFFDYTSEGAHIMGLAAAPDGTICGGTAFPMRFFRYDPAIDAWDNRDSYGQWNTVARQGSRFFVGGYGGGFLLDWNPAEEWVPTVRGRDDCNPQFLTECAPTINRPHELLPHPDGKTLVLAGTPGYGYTGGGLLFWNRDTRTAVVLQHTDILPEHSTMSLAPLPEGRLLGGTTTAAGTGGEKKAAEAELYILDMSSRKVEWHAAMFPDVQSYTDLCAGPGGVTYGIADNSTFFVFDAARREIVHKEAVAAKFGPTISHQGPRVFVVATDATTYILFAKGIARIDPETFEVTLIAESPVAIGPGGDFLNGRIYFGSGSHMYSYAPE